jgi:TonB family protein
MQRLFIAICVTFISASAQVVLAQDSSWIDLAPPDGSFHVLMPHEPKADPVSATYNHVNASGVWYTARDGASYAVWSLVDSSHDIGWGEDSYLDVAADLFWQELLQPARYTLRDQLKRGAAMAYVKDLPSKPLSGREYSVTLGGLSGTAYIFVADHRIFILLAANTADGPWERERFLGSFKVSPDVKPMILYDDPKGFGAVNDDEPIYSTKEVDQKARILEKPEPSYTESARMFQVQGTVVLRAVFSKSGQADRIEIVRRLPHGLTERCLAAVRAIKFSPAIKDGKPVSTWIQLESNFNLY